MPPNTCKAQGGQKTKTMKNNVKAQKIVEKLGEYVNGLDRRNLGMPMMDEIAVMQMEHIVRQILKNPDAEVEVPIYD